MTKVPDQVAQTDTKRETPRPPDLPMPTGPFPRRALAISINDYLFANPINYGMPIGRPQRPGALEPLPQPTGLRIPASQIGILSDAASGRP